MEQMFMADLAKSEEIKIRKWMRRSWLDKLKEGFAERFKPQL